MPRLSTWALPAALSLAFTALPSKAQDFGDPPQGPMRDSVEWTLGLGVGNGPAYLGAAERRTRALPLVAVRFSNGWFAGIGGVGYCFSSTGPVSGGLRLTVDRGRDENLSPALRGMGDIPVRPEIGAFGDWRLLPGLSLRGAVRYGSGLDRNGLLADVGLRGMLPLGDGSHRLSAGLTVTAANAAALQSQFGVTTAQSLGSGYAPYTTGAGLRDVTAQLGYGTSIAKGVALQLGVSAKTLLGDAKDSPLVRKDHGTSLFGALAYRF